MQDEDVLIEVKNLKLILEQRKILNHIDLVVRRGEILTILGPNGAGKSCLLKCILGLLNPTDGQVKKRPGLKIGYTPQKIVFDPSLPITVEQFLKLGHTCHIDVQKSLNEVKIGHMRHAWMYALSGGELQRVLLARALSHNPDLLVLDEPAAGVDIVGQSEVYKLLAEIKNNHQCGILVVSHDLSLVMAETDHVVCLNKHVCCSGTPEVVAMDPAFKELFGMDATGLALYKHRHDHHHDIEGEVMPNEDAKDD